MTSRSDLVANCSLCEEARRYIRPLTGLSISSFLDIGAEPTDSETLRLQKQMLVTVASLGVVIGLSWGLAPYLLGEPLSAAVPGFYGVSNALSI